MAVFHGERVVYLDKAKVEIFTKATTVSLVAGVDDVFYHVRRNGVDYVVRFTASLVLTAAETI